MFTNPAFINTTSALQVQQKALQMMLAVPPIMASRIWMIATSPFNPQLQLKEINQMVTEKQNAFLDSIAEVNSQILSSQMNLTNQYLQRSQDFMWGNFGSFNNFDKSVDKETIKIIDSGLTPYAKTVKSNKERLLN